MHLGCTWTILDYGYYYYSFRNAHVAILMMKSDSHRC